MMSESAYLREFYMCIVMLSYPTLIYMDTGKYILLWNTAEY